MPEFVAKNLGIFFFQKFKKDVRSIVGIKYLWSNTKDQKPISIIDIDNDAISYIVQCSHIKYIPFGV